MCLMSLICRMACPILVSHVWGVREKNWLKWDRQHLVFIWELASGKLQTGSNPKLCSRPQLEDCLCYLFKCNSEWCVSVPSVQMEQWLKKLVLLMLWKLTYHQNLSTYLKIWSHIYTKVVFFSVLLIYLNATLHYFLWRNDNAHN